MIEVERVEAFGTLDLLAAQRNFERLGERSLDAGGQRATVRFGVGTLTFSAAAQSGGVNVTHGLGRMPAVVVCTGKAAPAFGELPIIHTFSWDDTIFQVNAESKSSWTGTVDFCWIAIG